MGDNMNSNQIAIVAGVQKWLENNKGLVEKCLVMGAQIGVQEYAIQAGAQAADKVEAWLRENRSELVDAFSGQIKALAVQMGIIESPGATQESQQVDEVPVDGE